MSDRFELAVSLAEQLESKANRLERDLEHATTLAEHLYQENDDLKQRLAKKPPTLQTKVHETAPVSDVLSTRLKALCDLLLPEPAGDGDRGRKLTQAEIRRARAAAAAYARACKRVGSGRGLVRTRETQTRLRAEAVAAGAISGPA